MRRRKVLVFLFTSFVAMLSVFVPLTPVAPAQTSPSSLVLRISGTAATPLQVTIEDLKKMQRKTLSVVNPHDKKKEVYEGVLLEELLRKAGVPQGEQMRGASMASYVLVEAEDGYRVIFSLAELDSGILDSEVIVADTMDGTPLPAKQGPFKLVAPHDKRPARWVRMVKSITLVRVPAQ
ncbi:MAG TPA: molybdopterin-dependent oxidoreductase [Candidatus Acidoferrum sp.]|nr:molybdopterin-dependent oxidoreductase [Candidatus Acidoferrum sp.]